MLHPKVDTFVQYNTRPRSSEVRALCWCAGDGVRDEAVDWKRLDVDMAAYNARRVFRDHDQLLELMLEYRALAASRPDLFANEPPALTAWRTEFVQNSIAFAGESKAHGELAAQDAAAPGKLVRFCDKL
jgi:integrase